MNIPLCAAWCCFWRMEAFGCFRQRELCLCTLAQVLPYSIVARLLMLKHTLFVVTEYVTDYLHSQRGCGGQKKCCCPFFFLWTKDNPQLGWGTERCCSFQHLFLWFRDFFSLIVPPVYYADAWIARCSQLYRTSCTLLSFVFCQLPWEKEGVQRGEGSDSKLNVCGMFMHTWVDVLNVFIWI